jgi:glycosyltransferase involved in cell wall biosynthesis
VVPRVIRNDWSRVTVPDLDGWRPTLTVSVVVPAFQCQSTLDLTLAALSRQTYPADLLEVIVVDDGSDPPLTLPSIRPEGTTLLRVPDSGGSGWGRSNALRWAAAHSRGEILHWLDADMVAFPEHVAAQARWHHVVPYAVTLGYKRFVDPAEPEPWPAPAVVAERWRRGEAADLFGGDPGKPHIYLERYIAQTNQLRTADHLAFRAHVGATAALRRELYEAAGGFDPQMRLAGDTELGYRLAQAGAVFVPEPRARSWHLGPTHIMRAGDQVARYHRPFLADRVPYPRHWRTAGGPTWTVPLAEVVVPVAGEPLERVRAAVDSVLRGTEHDVRVNLVGPWDQLDDARVPVLTDPQLDLRLIAATYRGEARVRLVTEAPASAFPAPYLLELPAAAGLAPDAVRRLIGLADRQQVGVVRVDPGPNGHGTPATLWRTSALGRARWVRSDGESSLEAVASVHGRTDVAATAVGVIDLARFDRPRPRWRPTGWVPSTVEVEGVRSLAKATVVVAWLAGRRLAGWLSYVAGVPARRRARSRTRRRS